MPASSGTPFKRRVPHGGLLLVLSGLLFLTTPILVVGTITPPEEMRVITEASALAANSVEWRVGMTVTFAAFATLTLGSFALYAHLARTDTERWALAGLIVTVGSIFFYVPLLGVLAYVLPAVGGLIENGGSEAIVVLDRSWATPFIVLPFLGGLLWNVGVALMGVAVWRSGTPSYRGGVALVIAGVIGIPGFLDVEIAAYLSPVVLAIGLVLVGGSMWRSGFD